MSDSSVVLMTAAGLQQALDRLACAIAERVDPATPVVLVGIQRRGVFLAQRLSLSLSRTWNKSVPVGSLDVAMHRDDLDQRSAPPIYATMIPFDVTGKTVVLVDDVLFKGRTVRAAMDALNDLGRPQVIQLAVLIDRGHRELPIQADFVGQEISTAVTDRVNVELREVDNREGVFLHSNGLAK